MGCLCRDACLCFCECVAVSRCQSWSYRVNIVKMKGMDLGLGCLQCHTSPRTSCSWLSRATVFSHLSFIEFSGTPNILTHIKHLAQCLAYSKYSININYYYYRLDLNCRWEALKASINPQERGPQGAEGVLAWVFGAVLIYLKFILKSNVQRSPDKNRKKKKSGSIWWSVS